MFTLADPTTPSELMAAVRAQIGRPGRVPEPRALQQIVSATKDMETAPRPIHHMPGFERRTAPSPKKAVPTHQIPPLRTLALRARLRLARGGQRKPGANDT